MNHQNKVFKNPPCSDFDASFKNGGRANFSPAPYIFYPKPLSPAKNWLNCIWKT